jgi:signal transduction histidine kinase
VANYPSRVVNRFVRPFLLVILLATIVAYFALYASTVSFFEEEVAASVYHELENLETVERLGGLDALRREIGRRADRIGETGKVYLLATGAGRVLAGDLETWPPGLGVDGNWMQIRVATRKGPLPIPMIARAVTLADGNRLLVGHATTGQRAFGLRMVIAFAGTAALILFAGFAGAAILFQYFLKRVEGFADTIDEVMRGNLSRRFKTLGEADEFDQLAHSLNAMLARLEELINAMRTVTEGVAHDFRGSLTRLQVRLERTLQQPRSGEEPEKTLMAAQTEVDGMLRILNSLLEIARAEAGLSQDQMIDVDLTALVEDLGELYQPLAEEQGLRLKVDVKENLKTRGQAELLAQAISNLIDNALKYSPAGGEISVFASQVFLGPYVVIADQGPGIPVSERTRVLERFVRLDQARSTPGAGLGLSLVAAVAKLHGAVFELDDNEPGLRAVLQFVSTARA